MATIVDIAKKLNVSPSTVSRALADSKEVSEKTRRKVVRLARTLNYIPNLVARNLRRASTATIGCLVFEYTNPFFVPMIQGIEDVASAKDYVVTIGQSHRDLANEKKLIHSYSMHQISGLIIMPVIEQTKHVLSLQAAGTPVIAVGRILPRIDCISIDNSGGAALIAEHFAGLGHRKTGMVLSGSRFNEAEQSRLRGYRKACGAVGLDLRKGWVFAVGNSRIEEGKRGADGWHRLKEKPDAVFCSNDRLAVGFIHRLRRLGYAVPADCAVAGFDDIPDSEYLEIGRAHV